MRRRRAIRLGTCLFALAATPLAGQTVEHIDLDQVPYVQSSLFIRYVASVGPLVYFRGDDAANGQELWRSDGTREGTYLLRDIAPGPKNSGLLATTPVGNALYFVAGLNEYVAKLWITDGTVAGTREVTGTDGVPLQASDLTAVGNTLYFVSFASNQRRLMKTDGTPAGTVVVHTFADEGPVTDLTGAGSLLYFAVNQSDGHYLWRSDGTPAGTGPIFRMCPAYCVTRLAASGGSLYFVANDPATGNELWTTSGTAATTHIVRDISPGTASTPFREMADVSGTLFFTVDGSPGALWKTNGTESGTVPIVSTYPRGLASAGGLLLFVGGPGEIWRSDGTTAGTYPLANPCGLTCSFDGGYVQTAGHLGFLFVKHPVGPVELWRTDGTTSGTFLVTGFSLVGSDPDGRAAGPGGLYFMAADAVNGYELWRSDGSGPGTVMVTQTASSASSPRNLAPSGARLFWNGSDGVTPSRVWTTLGTAATTHAILAPSSAADFEAWAEFRGGLLFSLQSNFNGLWRTDGTEAGTQKLLEVNRARSITALGDLALVKDTQPGALGFIRTDGTPSGTQRMFGLYPTPPEVSLNEPVAAGDLAFFTSLELWRTDGFAERTTQVSGRTASLLTPVGTRVFYKSDDVGVGEGLFVSDGTIPGTRHVHSVKGLRSLREANGRLYFVGNDGTSGPELWRTNAAGDGATLVADIRPGPEGSEPAYLTSLGAWLYFVADDGVHGYELWRTDGTPSGTVMIKDVAPGPASPFADVLPEGAKGSMGVAGDRLLFAAYRADTGVELWTSDGSAAGTVLLEDIDPGPSSSNPGPFATAGARTYFPADDGTGAELWSVLATGPAATVTDVVVAEGDTGLRNATFLVGLTTPAAVPVVVSYQTADVTATAGSDYQPRAGAVTFPAGTVGPVAVDVPVVGDRRDEVDEWFALSLVGASGASLPDPSALGTVRDDDAPRYTVADVSVPEDGGPAHFTVTLHTADAAATVEAKPFDFYSAARTANVEHDYWGVNGALTFPAASPDGSTLGIDVAIIDDDFDEPDESFELRVRPRELPDVQHVTGRATIVDDDGAASVTRGELTHGASFRGDLRAGSGQPARDWYLMWQEPRSSYEIVADEAAGETLPLVVRRMSADGSTTVAVATPVGTGGAVSMAWQNEQTFVNQQQHISVESGACGGDCGPDDRYRIRAYDTTGRIARINVPSQQSTTVLILQNLTGRTVTGKVWFWRDTPTNASGLSFTLPPRGSWTFDASQYLITGFSGSATITHDGGYGALAGKAVNFDTVNGYSFDTPMTYRPR